MLPLHYPVSRCLLYSVRLLPEVSTLAELAARCVASYIPFELVEHVYPPVPEQLQLRIAFWSFPDNEEDIRLYSCLANSSADEFNRGDSLFRLRAVKDPLQIGKFVQRQVINARRNYSNPSTCRLSPLGQRCQSDAACLFQCGRHL